MWEAISGNPGWCNVEFQFAQGVVKDILDEVYVEAFLVSAPNYIRYVQLYPTLACVCFSSIFLYISGFLIDKNPANDLLLRGSGYLGYVDSNQSYNPYKWVICPQILGF